MIGLSIVPIRMPLRVAIAPIDKYKSIGMSKGELTNFLPFIATSLIRNNARNAIKISSILIGIAWEERVPKIILGDSAREKMSTLKGILGRDNRKQHKYDKLMTVKRIPPSQERAKVPREAANRIRKTILSTRVSLLPGANLPSLLRQVMIVLLLRTSGTRLLSHSSLFRTLKVLLLCTSVFTATAAFLLRGWKGDFTLLFLEWHLPQAKYTKPSSLNCYG